MSECPARVMLFDGFDPQPVAIAIIGDSMATAFPVRARALARSWTAARPGAWAQINWWDESVSMYADGKAVAPAGMMDVAVLQVATPTGWRDWRSGWWLKGVRSGV